MPSLLTTKNEDGPRFGDWGVPSKRQAGQVFMGQKMLENFSVPGTDEEAIVRSTIQECLDGGYTIWLRFDGALAESFAILEDFNDEALNEEAESLRAFGTMTVKLFISEIKPAVVGTPIERVGSPKKFKLRVQLDSKPNKKNDKKMNVVIPSDFATFQDQYLQDMTDDIETLTTTEDVPYLLSSLTFRRCL
ncbi:hypothetical protein [Sedimentitalea sp.]|uniref:hypothetical protein n=2 Tax=Sedimentitalea sp. TaxID=2048915 RepID=UPI003266305E